MPPVVVRVDSNAAEQSIRVEVEAAFACGSQQPPGREVTVETRRLDVADVELVCGSARVLVERKTSADLASSIGDGRYKEQKSRILSERAGGACTALYVVEVGSSLPDWWVSGSATAGMPLGAACAGAVMNTSVRDHIPVLLSKDKQHTARLLVQLAKAMASGRIVPGHDVQGLPPQAVAVHALPNTRKAKVTSPKSLAIHVLSQVPGVSTRAASALVEQYSGLNAILRASEAELADVRVGQRRLGPKCAERVLQLRSW